MFSRRLRDRIKDASLRRPLLAFVYNFGRVLRGQQLIFLDYPADPQVRYGFGKPPNPKLYEVINRNRADYRSTLEQILGLKDALLDIPARPAAALDPYWINNWLPGLDIAVLYGMISLQRPRLYLEVGSGTSTKVARRAIRDHGLQTRVISIDPRPRAEIDRLCDTVIRQPLEAVDLAVFDQLAPGDVLFLDGSHRVFQNSDVTVAFLEVLPRLKAGVLVQVHDIFLPYDYPPELRHRFYSEQYPLGTALAAEAHRFQVLLPNFFISQDPELSGVLAPLWDDPRLAGLDRPELSYWGRRGLSFWMRMA